MPRKLIAKFLPHRDVIHGYAGVSWFRRWLTDENLWHLNRKSVSRGAAIGVFCAMLPMPLETIPAVLLALAFRANIAISVIGVWISNPITWVPLYAPAYLLGASLLGETQPSWDEITMQSMLQNVQALWLGCLVVGFLGASAVYALVHILWRVKVVQDWRSRRSRKSRSKSVG